MFKNRTKTKKNKIVLNENLK